jgi:nucleoside-diphosphate-sugar epimerase
MSDDSLALVTGCPGWLGNRLLHFLREDHPDWPQGRERPRFDRIRSLALPGAPRDRLREIAPGLEVVEGDVRDPASLSRFFEGAAGATVFHLAGLIHPHRVRELYDVNARGTENVIEAAAAAGAARIVATSSNSPAGAAKDPSVRFDESTRDDPYLAYGRSKQIAEAALREAQAAGRVEAVILRPCWFYGPEQPPRQTLFFKMIKDGKAPIVGSGEAMRSMSYVDNTSLGLLLAAASDRASGETYWIADRRPYSMNEIVDTVEDVLERDFSMDVAHKRMRLPNIASGVAYAVDASMQSVGLYQQKIHVLSEMNKTIACRIDKAERELGYKPGVELREGMRRSVEWCLANGQAI